MNTSNNKNIYLVVVVKEPVATAHDPCSVDQSKRKWWDEVLCGTRLLGFVAFQSFMPYYDHLKNQLKF